MNADPTAPAPADRSDAPAAAAFGEAWPRMVIERQIWLLGQLAEGGLRLAQAVERRAVRQAEGAPGDAAPPAGDGAKGDGVAAYARVARAVRLTVLLQSRLLQDLLALERRQALDAAMAQAGRPRELQQRKPRLTRIIGRVAQAEHEDDETVERLMGEAAECLDHDDIYGDVLTRPASEIIDRICRDLGLSPDWPSLAQEAWAREEMRGRSPGVPLAALMPGGPDGRRPFAGPEPEPPRPRDASP